MEAGKLDRRVVIQEPTVARGTGGGVSSTYATIASVWASYRALSGRELMLAQQLAATAQAEFIIRYRPGLLGRENCRVVWKGVNYDIQHIGELGRNDGLRLLVATPGADDA